MNIKEQIWAEHDRKEKELLEAYRKAEHELACGTLLLRYEWKQLIRAHIDNELKQARKAIEEKAWQELASHGIFE